MKKLITAIVLLFVVATIVLTSCNSYKHPCPAYNTASVAKQGKG